MSTQESNPQEAPQEAAARRVRKVMSGTVVSSKMDKTVVVQVNRKVRDRKSVV